MPIKTIASTDVAGKRVLIRVDFNVPIEDGTISDDRRIREALPTIRSVLDRGGACILVSHLGRPEGTGFEADSSLRPVGERLSQLLERPVTFPSGDCTDTAASAAVQALKPGGVVLLENLRFHKGEKKGDPAFAAKLALGADIYCNDAFGTAHRDDASMVALPTVMSDRPRVAGLLLEKELRFLGDALANPVRPFAVVLGGAKVADKLPVIDHLLPKADHIFVGGAMAYTFLRALGRRTGSSRVEEELVSSAKTIINRAASLKAQLHFPVDHVCSTTFAEHAGSIRVFGEHIDEGFMGLDIGPQTQAAYALALRAARTIVWNGPMGVFEWLPYRAGTDAVGRAIANATKNGATTIVGGGDTASAAEICGVADQMSHVSTGGGASLEMLAGKPFRSVELLDRD